MDFEAAAPREYLGEDDTVNFSHPSVRGIYVDLTLDDPGQVVFAERAFNHVRDRIAHSWDVRDPRVTITAAEVADTGVGLCYAKSHLLVALLRCHGIPAGLCYQRLSDGTGGHVIHGLVAVWLKNSWHRLDPRGNKPGVQARFDLGTERLAFTADPAVGEIDYSTVFASPVEAVLAPVRAATDVLFAELADALPAPAEPLG